MRLWLLLLLGCGGKDGGGPPALPQFQDTSSDSDSGMDGTDTAVPEDTGVDFCEDAPVVTWNNFGQGFITEACQGCHASNTPDRYGAPETVVFDTVEVTWQQADRVLARATGDYPTMPPLGGTLQSDVQKLEYWLRCAEPGN